MSDVKLTAKDRMAITRTSMPEQNAQQRATNFAEVNQGLQEQPYGVKTIVSLNPIMVDGTGMCGGCRVDVGGETKFACVDGPEFDGHKVDFDLLSDRLQTYREFEQRANACADGQCRIRR